MIDIYETIIKHFKIIEKINDGLYSSGHEVFKIPIEDIPSLPMRSQHNILF